MCEDAKATVQSPGHSKEDLNRFNQAIQRLTVEVDGTQDQLHELERARHLAALQAEGASGSTKAKLAWLEAALQRAKQDIAKQLREYQELMIIKLGLDFEITTYRKLLEESRLRMGFGTGSLAQLNAPTSEPSSASGPTRLLAPGASSGALDKSAPGGGCALCGSSGCPEGLSCSGSRGC